MTSHKKKYQKRPKEVSKTIKRQEIVPIEYLQKLMKIGIGTLITMSAVKGITEAVAAVTAEDFINAMRRARQTEETPQHREPQPFMLSRIIAEGIIKYTTGEKHAFREEISNFPELLAKAKQLEFSTNWDAVQITISFNNRYSIFSCKIDSDYFKSSAEFVGFSSEFESAEFNVSFQE